MHCTIWLAVLIPFIGCITFSSSATAAAFCGRPLLSSFSIVLLFYYLVFLSTGGLSLLLSFSICYIRVGAVVAAVAV